MKKYVLVIDEGTTSARAIIYDQAGKPVASDQREITMYYPQPGWVEQDANEIWLTVQAVMATALIKAKLNPEQISGIGITNQRETTVIWDRNSGLPIYHAVVWQSRQTAPLSEKLIQDGYTDLIQEKTGLIVDAYFSATKIRYILDQVSGAQQRAEVGDLLFGTIDSWLLWKLTGGLVHATDYTNASRTMLFDINKLRWSQELLELLQIPSIMLPEVKDSSGVFGKTIPEHFFGAAIPIAGIIGDQQGALFGQLALVPGAVKNTYGTGSFIVMNTGKKKNKSKNGLLTTIGYAINGQITYALEGSVFVSGSAIQWLRDQMKLVNKSSESETLAEQSNSDDEVYVVPAFTGLGAPYWNPQARGAVFGLSRGTTRADFVKATLQSLAYQSRDVVDAMVSDTGIPLTKLHVDGGASLNNYLMQFQADLLQKKVVRSNDVETTSIGAAYLAGLATGVWNDVADLKELQGKPKNFAPKLSSDEANRLYRGWQKAIKATEFFSAEVQNG
ncbi:glycerol kinase GlpK [Fructilactobacillus myrtifloralis]|uniref:Glycerol kinase n=1 Tax=Fructilactobacillus myrtifloralis TaxID=2940301 RepID=A0ABY5BTZ2_9LACO|nr:glycerol kinase GlpK [Fructilactobacillus myrtifloralis]USS85824.1 glycerol kinase GlpK [Fructilactobacillus myrtifloralis]